ncbi:glutamate receptor U1-like, partial [Limulus polyphemus]|uniref:Glutamate receptor U1-like n=1 Tax=Limulus polyphemus TaxID=6850 RepID=A0ABM1T869_LIMPO
RPPFMIFERDKISGERIGSSGILTEVLNVFKQAYGFSYRLLEPYDGQWGKELDNGTWNGMIGMVIRKEVDLAASSITMTDKREAVIDFTIPFFQESSTILLPRMRQQSDIFSFVAPLEWEVWLWMFFSLFLVSMLIYAVNRQVHHVTIPYPQYTAQLFSQWYRPLWYNIGALLQQGGFMPLLHSSRILLMAWLLVVLVVMNLYKGTLIAFLTIPKTYKFADSLEELASQNMIKWTFLKNTAYEALFSKNSDSEVMRKIGKPFDENPDEFVSTSREGVERVLTGKYAFIKEKSYLEASIEEDFQLSGQCRFSLAREEFYPVGYGLALQSNSPFLELFNLLMRRMIQAGLLVKWHKDYFDINNDCTSLSQPKLGEHSLTLIDLQGSFALLGIGLSLSVSAFLLEQHRFTLHSFAVSITPQPVAYVEEKPAIKLSRFQYLIHDIVAALEEVCSIRKINLTFIKVPRTLDETQLPNDKRTLKIDAIFSVTYCSSEKKIRNYATKSVLPVFVAQFQKCGFRSLRTVVVRAYQMEEVHIAAGSLTITRDREDAIDFTFPFYEEPTKILLPQPEEESKLWAVAKPFRWQVNQKS